MPPIACPVVTTMPAWAELDRPQGRKELPRACAAIRVWNRAIETVRCVFEYLPHLPQRRLAVFGGQDRRKDRFHGRHRLIPRHGRISVVSGVAGRPRLAQQLGSLVFWSSGSQVCAIDGFVDTFNQATVCVIDTVLVGYHPQQVVFEFFQILVVHEPKHEVEDIKVKLRIAPHGISQIPPVRLPKPHPQRCLDEPDQPLLPVLPVLIGPRVEPPVETGHQIQGHPDRFPEWFLLPHPHRQGDEPLTFTFSVFHAHIIPLPPKRRRSWSHRPTRPATPLPVRKKMP